MEKNFIFIFLSPLIIFGLFEIFFFWPNLFYLALFFSNLVFLFSLKKIKNKKIISKEFWQNSILPILFINSIALYSLILTTKTLIQTLFIANYFFIFLYLKNINRKNNEKFLENISAYGGFLNIYFLFSFFYGLKSLLGISAWVLIIILTVVTIIAVYEVFWANNISMRVGGIYLFLICLLIIQLTWAFYFLPLNYNFLGLILAICYYIIIGLTKPFLRNALNKKIIKLYLICGFSGITAVLLAAKWL